MRAVAIAIAFLLTTSAAPAADDTPRGKICVKRDGNALMDILRPRTCAPAPATAGRDDRR
jgi:hypothetical protein